MNAPSTADRTFTFDEQFLRTDEFRQRFERSRTGKRTLRSRVVTIDDLRSGRCARITERQLDDLGIRGRRSAQADRHKKKGIRFSKDENGRVWYMAEDVLAYIDTPKHQGTNEYDTSAHLARLEKARQKADQRKVMVPSIP